jgi:hypothetical protein
VLPFLAAGHGLGERLGVLLVVVAQGLVAGRQVLMAGGAVVVARLAGGLGFGGGADGAQAGVEGSAPGPAQVLPGVAGGPGGLSGVGVAEQPQPSVGQGPDAGSAGRAEGGECLVPGGPLGGCPVAGFGADGVAGMLIAVHFPVGGDHGGLVLPIAAGGRADGHGTEPQYRADRPGREFLEWHLDEVFLKAAAT